MCFCCVHMSSCMWQCPLLGAESKFSSLLWVSEIKLRLGWKTPQTIFFVLFCFETKSYHITLTCNSPYRAGLALNLWSFASTCTRFTSKHDHVHVLFYAADEDLPPPPKGWDFGIVAVFQLSTFLFNALSLSWAHCSAGQPFRMY